MTYQELIDNIRDLGFSDDSEMEEFGELVPNSINRAITEINLEVSPIIERYEVEITDEDEGYMYITMPDIDDNFLDFADVPVLYATTTYKDGVATETPYYKRFNDYEIEAGDTIVINCDELGLGRDEDSDIENSLSLRVFYKAAHVDYDGSQLLEEMPLPKKVHYLVPLLASYYIWLEDEPTKAAQYYNLYEQKKDSMTVNAKPKMRILSGGI